MIMHAEPITIATIIDTTEGVIEYADRVSETEGFNYIIFDRSCRPAEKTDPDDKAESFGKAYDDAVEVLKEKTGYHKAVSGSAEAELYRQALDVAPAGYICFTNQYVYYDNNTAALVRKMISDYPDQTVFSLRFRSKDGADEKKAVPSQRADLVDLNTAPYLHLFLHACFIKTDTARKYSFSSVCEEETAIEYLLKVCIDHPYMVLAKDLYCEYTKELSRKSDNHYGCQNKDYYIPSVKNIYRPLFRRFSENSEQVPLWLQKAVYYQLYFKCYANLNLRNKFLLDKEEAEEFFSEMDPLLEQTDDRIIMDNTIREQLAPPFALRDFFMYRKYHGDMDRLQRNFVFEEGRLFYEQAGVRYDMSDHLKVRVRAMNIRHDRLCLDLSWFAYNIYEFDPDCIYLLLGDEKICVEKTDYYSHDKIFGESVKKEYTFYVEVPFERLLNEGNRISVVLQIRDIRYELPMDFYRAPSKLNLVCPNSYWRIKEGYFLEYQEPWLIVREYTEADVRSKERKYLLDMSRYLWSRPDHRKKIGRLIRLRIDYLRHRKEYKARRIWMYFDKLYKAGDNGEYAFRYAFYNDKTIESYYVINEDSLDYPRLKKEFGDRILVYSSYKCMFYALVAETIVATHPDIIEFFGYDSVSTRVMKDLFNPYLVCIAHGITIQKNADYQNRLFDNTMFYTTSSKYEVNHILRPIYGYHADEVALTGMARFDGLINKDKKQILITPTWRRNLVGTAQRNTTREYADSFKNSAYYKIYNSLINDQRLIATAEKTGYKVIFLLHPSMSAQIDDYDRNEYVDIIPATGDMSYEKILTESSLMITDYSGIHYDFGYMRKPVIYYQPKEIPMRFEEGGMKFKTMGFGPVCTEYDDAVTLICRYMEVGCAMPDEFRQHADDFFAFDDYNNCERIHKAVSDWIQSL